MITQSINNQTGFAFITLLLFIAIMSELIINMMHSINMERRTNKNFEAYYRHLSFADIALKKAQEDLIRKTTNQLTSWHKIENASLKNYETLEYRVRFLQTVACFQIKGSKITGADFFSIDIQSKNPHETFYVQSTIAKDAKNPTVCKTPIKALNKGYLSWRVVEE